MLQDLLDFKDVNEAFSCLSDPTKRALYDIKIAPAPVNEKPFVHEVTNIVMQPRTKQDKEVGIRVQSIARVDNDMTRDAMRIYKGWFFNLLCRPRAGV